MIRGDSDVNKRGLEVVWNHHRVYSTDCLQDETSLLKLRGRGYQLD